MLWIFCKDKIYNALQENEVWLTLVEGSNLLGISGQAVRKNRKAGKYVTMMVSGNGGMQYRIALSSLPESAQIAWRIAQGLEVEILPDLAEKEEGLTRSFESLSPNAQKVALLKYDIVRLYQDAVASATHGKILEAKEAFVARFNAGHWPHLLAEVGPVSWKSIDTHWIPKLKASGGRPSSIAPGYRYTRFGRAVVGISALQEQVILGYFQQGNALKISEVVRRSNNKLHKMGHEQVSESRVRRFLKEYSVDHAPEVTMMRHGEKAYDDTCAPWIKRNPELILPGDIFIADGHTLNFMIQDPVRRKNRRMTVIFHEDMRTKTVAGWEIMPTESTQAIAASLRRAMLWMGFLLTGDEDAALVPRTMLLDNGKAFKSKYFTALGPASLEESGVAGLFDELRPYGFKGVQFARAYHGQTKPVERTFGSFAELERSMVSYSGTSIAYKPARLMRGEFLHRELAELLQSNIVPTLEEAHYLVALWVHEHHQRPSKQSRYLNGRCPYEALDDGFEKLKESDGLENRIISGDELRFLMMQSVTRSLKRNGIQLFNRWFLSPELHDLAKGERELLVRYDLDRMDRIAVYHPNGEFLCVAVEWCPNGGIHPQARLLGSAEDNAAFAAVAKQQADLRNGTKQKVRKSVLAAAAAGFGEFVGREVAPDVARLRAASDEEQKRIEQAAKRKNGTDGMEIPAEWLLVEPEPVKREDLQLPHYLDCQNEGF
ncbi:MAG: transposase [Chlorobiales bacterium]|nr:transposase [Chlorobiales bacterium]